MSDFDAPGRWANRIIGHGDEDPTSLLANPKNARVHPRAQTNAVSALLDTVGWVAGVIVNRRTGFIVDGHLRVAEAISADEPSIPVTYVDLSDEDENYVLAFYDATTDLAVTDVPMFRALVEDLAIPEALAGIVDDLSGMPPEPAGETPEEDGEVPEADMSWGYATFGKTKVGCSVAEVDQIQRYYDDYVNLNEGEDVGFVRHLITAAEAGDI